jgi:hypothetical protein
MNTEQNQTYEGEKIKFSNVAVNFTGIIPLLKQSKGLLETGLWIRIRIGSGFRDFVDPDPIENPDPGQEN